jgi:hypothetical protein
MPISVAGCFSCLARLFVGISWLWFACALVFLTDSACPFEILFCLITTGLLIGVFWVLLTAVWMRLIRMPVCFWWYSVPLVGLLAFVLAVPDVGFRTRVMLSERALADDVERVRNDGLPPDGARRVGLFKVNYTEERDKGVYLFTSQGFFDRHGIAHIPPGSKVPPRISVRPLFGLWFRFEERF